MSLANFLPMTASNMYPPNLYLLSSYDYRHEPLRPASLNIFNLKLVELAAAKPTDIKGYDKLKVEEMKVVAVM
jgi:hypothetical protein